MSEMTATQTDETIAKIRQGLDDDTLALLLADIFEAGRTSAIEDIKIDLADWDQTEAVEIITSNY